LFHDLKDTLKAIVDRLAQAHRNLTHVDESSHAAELNAPEIISTPDDSFSNEAYPEIEFSPTPVNVEDYPEPPVSAVQIPEKIELADSSFLEPEVKTFEEPAVVPQKKVAAPEKPAVSTTDEHKMSLLELKDALAKDPCDLEVLRQFGKKLQKAGLAREGEQHLLRALELEPRNVENHFALADFYQAQGLKLKAFRHLNIILQMDPENEKALTVLGLPKKKSILYRIERRT
jgi:tetratricopeptide (TPR) repeat protein